MSKKKILIKILLILSISLILTMTAGTKITEYFYNKTIEAQNNSSFLHVSPYKDLKNKEYIEAVLNGGGNTIIGTTRVFNAKKEDFRDVTFEDYTNWTKENFEKYDCLTIEDYEKNILCNLKGYIVFEDNSAIKYFDGVTTYTKVTPTTFNYLNGFSQDILQESRHEQNKQKPKFFYKTKNTSKADTETEFNLLKEYIFKDI